MPATATPPTTSARESRILKASDVAVRKLDNGNYRVTGYAAKFNILSHDLGGFVEQIKRGAFARAISDKQDCTFLWMHRRETIMARTTSGTLRLEEDATGLKFEADVSPELSDGKDLYIRLERKDVTEMSFSFRAVRQDWNWEAPIPVRTLVDLDLYDVAAVDEGAYPETEIGIRCLQQAKEERAAAAKPPANIANAQARLRLAEAETVEV